jgi:hypothetical protein
VPGLAQGIRFVDRLVDGAAPHISCFRSRVFWYSAPASFHRADGPL